MTATPPMRAPERPRILIVDDLQEKLLVFRSVLEELDAEVILARSGSEALKRILEKEFALILLDVNMPDIDGLETAKLIRRHRKAQTVPIIFITAYADDIQTEMGYRLGAVDYILSPIVPDILRTKVRVFLDLYRSQQALERRVEERTVELLEANRQLKVEIDERRRAEADREIALAREQALRVQAEELSRLKDEFLATMSHELRTPLNAIFGWITLLRTRQLDDGTRRRAIETIDRNARAQRRLIEDLLDISRIVSGKVTLELGSLDMRRLVETAVETMQPAAQGKGIKIVPLLDTSVGAIRGDPARLQQVVCNLLSNAIKFTDRGGQIEVCLARRNGDAEITVRDDGQGIKKEFLPYVFDRFRQEDGSISRRHGGLGLGLAIVRHLVELHGGTAVAESAGEGLGAAFTVRLPARAHVGRDIRLLERAANVDGESVSLTGVRVLAVDDDPGARELLARILEGYGAEVRLADSGATALTALFEHKPDVLIADIGMPNMDGYALIEQVRMLDPEYGSRIPAIAVTAYASAQDRLRALQVGYQNHVSKPVDPQELAVVVASLTGRLSSTDQSERSNPNDRGERLKS
ncbi:MAG: response regulator, partial [Steroidobacteraceae bacterium]